ncbi:MAG: YmaF family protein [Chitinophagales bacterium]
MSMELRRGEQRRHVHAYSDRTSVSQGHTHRLLGVSELPRPLPTLAPDGVHNHDLVGRTTFDDGHWHFYRVRTDENVDVARGEHFHRYDGQTDVAGGHTHRLRGRTEAAPDEERPRPGRGRLGELLEEAVEGVTERLPR